MFNYIVTIHNSADHLRKVLTALAAVKSAGSEVYCVLDGCTDESAAIVDDFSFSTMTLPNVRETTSITRALRATPQLPNSYNVILQDDVILHDDKFEEHILEIYKRFPDIGVLSLRHGANFEPDVLTNGKHVSERDVIQSAYQPYLKADILPENHITFRQVVYKSPIVISSEVVNKLGGYDERFAPIAHDDTEYCVRAFMAGYRNAVVALDVEQPIEWGGTRRHPNQPDNMKMHQEHMDLLRELYPHELLTLAYNPPSLANIKLW